MNDDKYVFAAKDNLPILTCRLFHTPRKKDNKMKKEKQDDKKSKKRKTRTSKNASKDDGWIFKPPKPGKED